MKHTPGPYEVLNDEFGPYRIVGPMRSDETRAVIADIEECDTPHARLIASAPLLLETCKEVLDIINSYSHVPAMGKACEILQAAIFEA